MMYIRQLRTLLALRSCYGSSHTINSYTLLDILSLVVSNVFTDR